MKTPDNRVKQKRETYDPTIKADGEDGEGEVFRAREEEEEKTQKD